MEHKITIQEGHYTREVIDHSTGEINEIYESVEVRPVIDGTRNITVKDRGSFGRKFLSMFPEDLYDLLVYGKIRGMELVVLNYLMATLDKNNATLTNLDIIAKDLGLHRNNVSTYINKLIRRNLIIATKVQKQRGSGAQTMLFQIPIAQLNYNLVYNSQIKEYKKVRTQHPDITQLDGVTLINQEKEQKRLEKIAEFEKRQLCMFTEEEMRGGVPTEPDQVNVP